MNTVQIIQNPETGYELPETEVPGTMTTDHTYCKQSIHLPEK